MKIGRYYVFNNKTLINPVLRLKLNNLLGMHFKTYLLFVLNFKTILTRTVFNWRHLPVSGKQLKKFLINVSNKIVLIFIDILN